MPNRKTFDQRDKYDHSSRSLAHPEKNDLKPDVNDTDGAAKDPESRKSGANASRRLHGVERR